MKESFSLRTPLIKRFVEACGILYKNTDQWPGMSKVYSVSTMFTVVKEPSTHLPYIIISNFKARGTAFQNTGTPCSLCLWPGVFGHFESL